MQIRAKKANLTVHITIIQIINGQQQLYIKQIQCHFISRSTIILHEFLSPSRFIIRTITSSNLTHTFLFTSLVIFLHNPQNVFLQSQTDIFGMKGQPMLQPTWWRHKDMKIAFVWNISVSAAHVVTCFIRSLKPTLVLTKVIYIFHIAFPFFH